MVVHGVHCVHCTSYTSLFIVYNVCKLYSVYTVYTPGLTYLLCSKARLCRKMAGRGGREEDMGGCCYRRDVNIGGRFSGRDFDMAGMLL